MSRIAFGLALLLLGFGPKSPEDESWDVTQPRGETREIDFVTSEGTWMSVDVSRDGRWLVFDLLAHIYRVPIAGGEAQCLTQGSGIAVNYHPRFSPDGRWIAFVSDRQGQQNLWIMEADGSNPRAVVVDDKVRISQPAWTPDGEYIVVRRRELSQQFRPSKNEVWMYHREGGQGVKLIDKKQPGARWPSVSPNGRHLYFHVFTGGDKPGGHGDPLAGFWQVRRWDFRTGQVRELTAGASAQQVRSSSGGAYAPEISPDGETIAFGRRVPDGTISYKGHRFGPRTALWLRDLETGSERVLMDPMERDLTDGDPTLRILPGYAWSPDGTSIFLSQGGKLRRVVVATGSVETIPFTARVKRTISEQAYASWRLTDEPLKVRFPRWPTASPDGGRVVFQAVGKLWLQDVSGGAPRRLTAHDFAPFEYSPAWSPDGRWLAFTTFDEAQRGNLWRVAATGGGLERLTPTSGEYFNPVWSPDSQFIVMVRGAGASARERAILDNPWYELVRINASGGSVVHLAEVRSPPWEFWSLERSPIVRPLFGPEGRVFFTEKVKQGSDEDERLRSDLVSIREDGTDRRVHLRFPFTDEMAPSPDGKHIAFQEGDNLYLAPFAWNGVGAEVPLLNRRDPAWPVTILSETGGLFPRWRNEKSIEFGSADQYVTYAIDSKEKSSVTLDLEVPRYQPNGTLAFTDARIITLDEGEVIAEGDVVVEGTRIRCAGDCDTSIADRLVDARGKFIIPGFVDMHAHRHSEPRGFLPMKDYEVASYLAYGVTTTLENSAWSQNTFPIADLIEAGLVVGPRTFSTGDPLFRSDWSRSNEIKTYQDGIR